MRKIFILTILLGLTLTGCGKNTTTVEIDVARESQSANREAPEEETDSHLPAQAGNAKRETQEMEEVEIPAEMDLPIPFVSQAPDGDWALPYQEACEESVLIMSRKYFAKEKLDKDIMDAEIKAVVAWENENFGYYFDTTLAEVKTMAEDYFHLKVAIENEVTVDQIKWHIAEGHLVLAPTAGRLLNNPYYSGKGPLYHILIIRGYDQDSFITNDAGLWHKGDGYKYDYETVMNAIHDLPLMTDGKYLRPYSDPLSDEEKEELMLSGIKKLLIVEGVDKSL